MEQPSTQTPGPENGEIETGKQPGIFRKAVVSASFVEKSLLLMATALTSGLLIPYISNKIQTTNAHNEIVLQSEAKLLDDITSTIITYQYLVGDVSYYKSDSSVSNDKLQALAFERYSARVVDLVSQWGVEIAKAKTLASPEISDKLDKFMDSVLKKQDAPMVTLFTNNGSINEWSELNELNGKMYEEAKQLITELAVDFKITKVNVK